MNHCITFFLDLECFGHSIIQKSLKLPLTPQLRIFTNEMKCPYPASLESLVTWPYLVRSQCWHAEALMCVPDLHCSVWWRWYHCRDNRRMYICAVYKQQRLCTCLTLTCFAIAAQDDVIDPVCVVLHRCNVRILLQDMQARAERSFQQSRGDLLSKLRWDHIYSFTLCWLTLHILMMESRPAVKSRLRAGSSCSALTPLRLYFSTSSLITYDTCNTHTLRIRHWRKQCRKRKTCTSMKSIYTVGMCD